VWITSLYYSSFDTVIKNRSGCGQGGKQPYHLSREKVNRRIIAVVPAVPTHPLSNNAGFESAVKLIKVVFTHVGELVFDVCNQTDYFFL